MKRKWINHDNNGMPLNLHPGDIVEVQMVSDNQVLSPMQAREIDWKHGDAVGKYRVVKEYTP